MLRSIFTSILVIILFWEMDVTSATAQQINTDQTQHPQLIRFTVESEIAQTSSAFNGLPTSILDKLVQYPWLEDVNMTKKSGSNYHLKAGFIFNDLEAFKFWYSSDEVKNLLNNLEDEDCDWFRININIQLSSSMREG